MKTKQQYYCDIPWKQVWDEFNDWFDSYDGDLEWEGKGGQEKKLQQILKATIPWTLPWREIWASHNNWWGDDGFNMWWSGGGSDGMLSDSWTARKRSIRKFVQRAADVAVNEESSQ